MSEEGVVVPRSADVGGDGAMYMKGDEGSELMSALYALAADRGYEKVRLDRAMDSESGAWFELGYVYGEVSVRWSHRARNTLFRRNDDLSRAEFLTFLQDNRDFATMEADKS